MSFSQAHVLRGIFSSSSLFSPTSKLPLKLPAHGILLKPFSHVWVISRLISLQLSPLQASALIPSSPFTQPATFSAILRSFCLPANAHRSKAYCFHLQHLAQLFFFFFFPFLLPSLFIFILALLSSPRRRFVHHFLSISCQSFLHVPQMYSPIRPQPSTRSDPPSTSLWVSSVLPHFESLQPPFPLWKSKLTLYFSASFSYIPFPCAHTGFRCQTVHQPYIFSAKHQDCTWYHVVIHDLPETPSSLTCI